MKMEDEHKVVLFRVEAEMRSFKAEVLEKGELTDFSFLVGPEGEAQLLHCFKSDLLMASDYFKALLRSPLTGPPPVRIKHVQPHIFKLILRFITVHNIPELSCVEDVLALTLAVDEFLLDRLKPFCQSEIDRLITVETVWSIYNKYRNNTFLQPTCIKVLSSEARKCIAHPTFLKASQESLLLFLQMEEMDIPSEIDLFDACMKFANNLSNADKLKLMKVALPHLRLFTLKADEMKPELLQFLTDTEKLYLLSRLCPTGIVADVPIPVGLNPNSSHRTPTRISKIMPGKHYLRVVSDCYLPRPSNFLLDSSTLSLYARHDVALTSIILHANSQAIDVVVGVSYPGGKVFSQNFSGMNLTIEFKKPVDIPKGVRFEVAITSKTRLSSKLISPERAKDITESLAKEPALSHIYFKNSVETRFQRKIVKGFLIGYVQYEIK